MKISPIAAGVVVCLMCFEAFALQLGQVTAASRLGEPLNARVELYGALPEDAAGITFDLRPDIGAPRGGTERAAIATIRARLVRDTGGYAYVSLQSSAAIFEPALSFRLRMRTATSTAIQHYALALAAPRPEPKTVRAAAPRPVVHVQPVASAPFKYGPVRPGQSLWRIMQQAGLAGGDTAATIARIVADNPHAFVGGDANRLRVGVMLTLAGADAAAPERETVKDASGVSATAVPEPNPVTSAPDLPLLAPTPAAAPVAASTAPAAKPSGSVPPPAGNIAAPVARDPEFAARLAALESKFSAIRARYAAQRQAPVAAPSGVPGAPAQAASAGPGSVSDPVLLTPEPPPAPAPVAGGQDSRAWLPIVGIALGVVAGLLMLVLLVRSTASARDGLRRRRAHRQMAGADDALRAEIARKAEKRVELEDLMRRGRTQSPDAPAAAEPAGSIERAVLADEGANAEAEAEAEAEAAVDEAENRIAHGFYSEAEALLKRVISTTPGNHRAKLRLAEIYYLNERNDEFVDLAGEIHRLHRADVGDENWQRIMRMGRIVAPERPPFSGPQSIENKG